MIIKESEVRSRTSEVERKETKKKSEVGRQNSEVEREETKRSRKSEDKSVGAGSISEEDFGLPTSVFGLFRYK